jgi:methionyl-tRNA synthetase
VLHVATQAVDDCNRVLAPFMPHSAQRIHEALGRDGVLAPQPEIREVDDLDGGPGYPVLMGDYQPATAWSSAPVVPGTPIEPPRPVFTKLDTSIVEEELARLSEVAGG